MFCYEVYTLKVHPKIVQAPTEDKEVMVGVAREENMVVEVRV